jgi:hypothetical protein
MVHIERETKLQILGVAREMPLLGTKLTSSDVRGFVHLRGLSAFRTQKRVCFVAERCRQKRIGKRVHVDRAVQKPAGQQLTKLARTNNFYALRPYRRLRGQLADPNMDHRSNTRCVGYLRRSPMSEVGGEADMPRQLNRRV